ncbi:TnsA-like heteromeric transposase endonuclease subunit [Streptomyces sp. NPDC048416]|uniref:TnsA-like heteromeric transposase endonuclease subunit n=1 Tax=Streptomyces sp. NPDC048416 TaxID=3365546 RepID=UPI003711963B
MVSDDGRTRRVRVLAGAGPGGAAGLRSGGGGWGSSQPFWLFWSAANGRPVSHAPDCFARRRDGSAVVIDCCPAEHRGPRDCAKFEAMEAACASVGWEFRLFDAPVPVVVGNVRWLAGYRHPRHRVEPVSPAAAGGVRRAAAADGRCRGGG